MNTNELPERTQKLKDAIAKALLDFNSESGLEIVEVHVQPLEVKEVSEKKKIISYVIDIGIDL